MVVGAISTVSILSKIHEECQVVPKLNHAVICHWTRQFGSLLKSSVWRVDLGSLVGGTIGAVATTYEPCVF